MSGVQAIKADDDLCLVQDPHEAAMPSLLLTVLRDAHVDGIFLIDDLASTLEVLARGKQTVGARKPMIDGDTPANERAIE